MKKDYQKPEAEFISLQVEENLAFGGDEDYGPSLGVGPAPEPVPDPFKPIG